MYQGSTGESSGRDRRHALLIVLILILVLVGGVVSYAFYKGSNPGVEGEEVADTATEKSSSDRPGRAGGAGGRNPRVSGDKGASSGANHQDMLLGDQESDPEDGSSATNATSQGGSYGWFSSSGGSVVGSGSSSVGGSASGGGGVAYVPPAPTTPGAPTAPNKPKPPVDNGKGDEVEPNPNPNPNPEPEPSPEPEPEPEPYVELEGNAVSFTLPSGDIAAGDSYSVGLDEGESMPSSVVAMKYIVNINPNSIGVNSSKRDEAELIDELPFTLDSPSPTSGLKHLHVLTVTEGGQANETVSDVIDIAMNPDTRTGEMQGFIDAELSSGDKQKVTDDIPSIDFVQPWRYSSATESEIIKEFKHALGAGCDSVILQSVAAVSGGAEGDPIAIDTVWYRNSDLDEYKTEFTSESDVVEKVMSAAARAGIGAYLGGTDNSQWWQQPA